MNYDALIEIDGVSISDDGLDMVPIITIHSGLHDYEGAPYGVRIPIARIRALLAELDKEDE